MGYSEFNHYLRINLIQNSENGQLTKSQQVPLLEHDPFVSEANP